MAAADGNRCLDRTAPSGSGAAGVAGGVRRARGRQRRRPADALDRTAREVKSLAQGWRPPLQLSPVTADVDEAREWLEAFKASGVEGLVVKGSTSRYQPGRCEWGKWKTGIRSR
ncbi:hypothetical protein [Kribbella sp. NPDC023855]|uniref:ATP-dependent DNA ligase n=1 Tax=Kribbella sp. NPDC023855 TaxID=3154698 RepID=UPI0033CD0245